MQVQNRTWGRRREPWGSSASFADGARNRSTDDRVIDTSNYRVCASILIVLELAGLATVWLRSAGASLETLVWSGHNLLLYPLILSIAGNALILLFFRRLERKHARAEPISCR
jgi:hypothetical protein